MSAWDLIRGDSPVVAVAVHDGHDVRQEVAEWMSLAHADRLREEDPFTGQWTTIAATRLIGLRSRFEVDLNRPRERAVYQTPEDAWGLEVWRERLPERVVEGSLELYDAFYAEVETVLGDLVARFGRVVVFDLHSYNHRREGPDRPPADPETHPEVNLGTRTMDRRRWGPVVERFLTELRAVDYFGRSLDARENVKFFGGHFPRWVHERFPESVCVLSVEFKKFFMDEWTGQGDPVHLERIGEALAGTVGGVLEELQRL